MAPRWPFPVPAAYSSIIGTTLPQKGETDSSPLKPGMHVTAYPGARAYGKRTLVSGNGRSTNTTCYSGSHAKPGCCFSFVCFVYFVVNAFRFSFASFARSPHGEPNGSARETRSCPSPFFRAFRVFRG